MEFKEFSKPNAKCLGKPSMISGPALTILEWWIVHPSAFIPSDNPPVHLVFVGK
jgi:hypothetical protein